MKWLLILMLVGRYGEISDIRFLEMPDKETCELRGEQSQQYYAIQNLNVQFKCVVDS